jgi:hypothetical protein
VIQVCDAAGNVIETHEHAGEFKEWRDSVRKGCQPHQNFDTTVVTEAQQGIIRSAELPIRVRQTPSTFHPHAQRR